MYSFLYLPESSFSLTGNSNPICYPADFFHTPHGISLVSFLNCKICIRNPLYVSLSCWSKNVHLVKRISSSPQYARSILHVLPAFVCPVIFRRKSIRNKSLHNVVVDAPIKVSCSTYNLLIVCCFSDIVMLV